MRLNRNDDGPVLHGTTKCQRSAGAMDINIYSRILRYSHGLTARCGGSVSLSLRPLGTGQAKIGVQRRPDLLERNDQKREQGLAALSVSRKERETQGQRVGGQRRPNELSSCPRRSQAPSQWRAARGEGR
ncbi:hypothetical protein BDW66DRAFT_124998 [Aspergillus desertorum]